MPLYKKIKQHKILLDTHVWIWIMNGEACLSKAFKNYLNDNQKTENIFVSAISIWELGMLVERKRIELEMDCLDWVEQSLEGINLLPLTPRIAIQSSRLPENPHGDPADRILIASAYEHNAVLITHDKKIINYGKGKYIGVYDPC